MSAETEGLFWRSGIAAYTVNTNIPTIKQKTGFDLSAFSYNQIFYIALSCIIIGASSVIAWLLASILRYALLVGPRAALDKLDKIQRKHSTLKLEPCNDDDIEAISQTAGQQFGSMAANRSRNQLLRSIDEKSYMKVIDGFGRIVGFYGIFRLTKLGRNAAMRGEFDIIICPMEYIGSDRKYKYSDVYLGGVYGKNTISRGMVVGAINQQLFQMSARVIFARAATKEGLRLLRNHGFKPVDIKKDGIGDMFMRKGD